MKKNILKTFFISISALSLFSLTSCGSILNSMLKDSDVTTTTDTFIVNTVAPNTSSLENWRVCIFYSRGSSIYLTQTLTKGTYRIYLCDGTDYSYYPNQKMAGTKVEASITIESTDNNTSTTITNEKNYYLDEDKRYTDLSVPSDASYTFCITNTDDSTYTGYCAFYVYKYSDTCEETPTTATTPTSTTTTYTVGSSSSSSSLQAVTISNGNSVIYQADITAGTYTVLWYDSEKYSSTYTIDGKILIRDSSNNILYSNDSSTSFTFSSSTSQTITIDIEPYYASTSGTCAFKIYKSSSSY